MPEAHLNVIEISHLKFSPKYKKTSPKYEAGKKPII